MLCSNGGGTFDSASLDAMRVMAAGRVAGRSLGFSNGASLSTGAISSTGADFLMDSGGGVSSLPPSNLAASDAVLSGRMVPCVDEDTFRVGEGMFRVGEVGGSAGIAVPLVLSHEGGFCDALLVVDWRRFACEGVVGVSLGLRGELLGVDGRTVDGELSLMEPGRRKGDWRGLLKESGEGLYGVGVVDFAC